MAGPNTEAFVEAIQWSLAHNIVQLAQPRPWWIIIYTFRQDRDDYAQPFALISKNEYGQPEGTVKVRMWNETGWARLH